MQKKLLEVRTLSSLPCTATFRVGYEEDTALTLAP